MRKIGFVLSFKVWNRFQTLTKAFPSSLSFKPCPTGERRTVMKMITKNRGRFAIALAIVAITLTLVACGGGGGSSPTPTPAPTPATGSITATNCAVPDGANACNSTVSWTTDKAVSPRVTVGGVSVSTLANSGATPSSFSVPLGITAIAVADGTTVLDTTDVVAACGTSSAEVNGICQPTAWWPPAVIHPIGEKVIGLNILPDSSFNIGDEGWKAAVQDGTIKVVDTGSVMTGYNTDPIVWMTFKRKDNLLFCTTPVFKKDGSPIGSFIYANSVCNTEEIDWTVGTQDGLIRHSPVRGECYQYKWDQVAGNFSDTVVSCP